MNASLSKKERALHRFSTHINVLQCPICRGNLKIDAMGVGCSRNHSFNLARKGYLSFFTGPQSSKYDEDLFQARREVFAAGVYDPLVVEIVELIKSLKQRTTFVVDAGCGEGSILAKVQQGLPGASFMGIDISRDGIALATSHQEPIMWCVADITRLPLAPASSDVVLSILSPANYGEFQRVLSPDGAVIKVLPGQDYLREIRARLRDVSSYSNEDVLAKLEDNLVPVQESHLHYTVSLTPKLWKAMVGMTPLSQHREVSGEAPESITIDLQVILGTMV